MGGDRVPEISNIVFTLNVHTLNVLVLLRMGGTLRYAQGLSGGHGGYSVTQLRCVPRFPQLLSERKIRRCTCNQPVRVTLYVLQVDAVGAEDGAGGRLHVGHDGGVGAIHGVGEREVGGAVVFGRHSRK